MRVFRKSEGVVGVDDLMDVSIGVLETDEPALQCVAALNSGTGLEKGRIRMHSLYSVLQVSGRPQHSVGGWDVISICN